MAIILYIFATITIIGFVGICAITAGDNYGFIKREPEPLTWLEVTFIVIFIIGAAGILISGWVWVGMEVVFS